MRKQNRFAAKARQLLFPYVNVCGSTKVQACKGNVVAPCSRDIVESTIMTDDLGHLPKFRFRHAIEDRLER
jgi:hypothetical protein